MKLEQLKLIVEKLKKGLPPPQLNRPEKSFVMHYAGKVVGKERPREARGHFYTPKETRDYEASVKKQAAQIMKEQGINIYRASVVAHLSIYDRMPDDWKPWQVALANSGYMHSWDGADLDNREKAIFDALNRIVYVDDRQIVQVYKFRRYSTQFEGFQLELNTTGLAKDDLDNIHKMMIVR